MAVKNKTITLKNIQFYEEDGLIYLEEMSGDGSQLFILNDILNEFNGDNRYFDLTIKEKVILKGHQGD